MKKRKMISLALSLAMVLSLNVSTLSVDAAAKPKLSASKITLTKGKTKKISIKGIKANKIKKTTWKSTNTKIVALSKKKKTTVTIKGKKAGSSTVRAVLKIKGKKKKTTLSAKIKVSTPASPTATPKSDIIYTEDFENGVGAWYARHRADNKNAKLDITTEESHSGKAALIMTGREATWESPTLDVSKMFQNSAVYHVSFWAKVANSDTKTGSKLMGLKISSGYSAAPGFDKDGWANWPTDAVHAVYNDKWYHLEADISTPAAFPEYLFYVESANRPEGYILIDDVEIKEISGPASPDLTLPSLKNTYASNAKLDTLGVAVGYSDFLNKNNLSFINHHFNSVTTGNEFKLDSMLGDRTTLKESDANGYVITDEYRACADNKDADGNVIVPYINFTVMDRILKFCKDNGLKLRVHGPIWHQQNPPIFFTKNYENLNDADITNSSKLTDKNTMYTREEMYLRTVLKHIFDNGYGDVVYAYDVVNEFLHRDNEGGTYQNYWKYIFGGEDIKDISDDDRSYVKVAFAAAYKEVAAAGRTDNFSLIFNEYNTYEPGNPEKIVELINYINSKDDINPNGNKICDGIGMQCHLNDSYGTSENLAKALDIFAAAGLEIQITELDITNTGTVDANSTAEHKAAVWAANGELWGKVMKTVVNKLSAGANITSVTIWGMTDAGSWRSTLAPLLFGANLADVKPAFNAVIEASKG